MTTSRRVLAAMKTNAVVAVACVAILLMVLLVAVSTDESTILNAVLGRASTHPGGRFRATYFQHWDTEDVVEVVTDHDFPTSPASDRWVEVYACLSRSRRSIGLWAATRIYDRTWCEAGYASEEEQFRVRLLYLSRADLIKCVPLEDRDQLLAWGVLDRSRSVWLGYAVNAITLAALGVLAVNGPRLAIGSLPMLNRARRTRRGQCPDCGYDRAGLNPITPCPECGRS